MLPVPICCIGLSPHCPARTDARQKTRLWIFSGCAVWDKNNSSGFCKTGGCLVAVYTADQPNLKKESQFVAFSNDGGMTYTNYANNPVIDLNKKDFRDPNVSWNEDLGKWLMVVALPKEHAVRFYASDNLRDWQLLSEFGHSGYAVASWECPAFMQLPVDGNPGSRKWVLLVSAGGPRKGPFIQYFVGDFDGREFKNDNPSDTILTVDYGDCFYAAIPWNNLPKDQHLYIGWMVPGKQETFPWRGQMSIPRDIGLTRTAKGIRLVQQPASTIRANRTNFAGKPQVEKKGLSIVDGEVIIEQGNGAGANATSGSTRRAAIQPGAIRIGSKPNWRLVPVQGPVSGSPGTPMPMVKK